MMVRLYTKDGELGVAELAENVTEKDLVLAMRKGQLYVAEVPVDKKPEQKPEGGRRKVS